MGSRLQDDGERNGWDEVDPPAAVGGRSFWMPDWYWTLTQVVLAVVLVGGLIAGIVYGCWWLIAGQ